MRKVLYLVPFLLLPLFLLTTGCQKKTERMGESGIAQSDTVTAPDGVAIHYETSGAGSPALVFVHGWSCDGTYWKNQIEHFSDRVKVVTVDMAGHGQSGTNRENWSIEGLGADVAAVVNKLNLPQVILVGHSMGGPVCIEAAKQLPGKVLGIIGADTFQSFTDEWTDEQKEEFYRSFEEDFATATANFVPTMFPENADSALVAKITADMSAAPPEVGQGCFRAMNAYKAVEALDGFDLPIIAINTDLWPTDVEGNKELVNFELILMPGLGHFPMLEDPQGFNDNLYSAVRTLAMGTGGSH